MRRKVPDTPEHLELLSKWYDANSKNEYRYKYDLNEDSVILDLGAYLGKWSKEMFRRYKCNIYAFEPVNEFYLKSKNLLNKHKRIRLFEYAIGNSNRDEEISFMKDGSTFFIDTAIKIPVKIRAIDEVLEELKLDNIDLIKMNVEGSEYEILEKLIETDKLSSIKNLQIQFHREADNYQERREKIHEELVKTHNCKYNYEFIWEGWSLR